MSTRGQGSMPTLSEINRASTILSLEKIAAVASQATRYKAYTKSVNKNNYEEAKARTALAVLGRKKDAGKANKDNDDDDDDDDDEKLLNLLDSCSSCNGKELKGLFEVPAIAKLKNGDRATIVAEILKHHFATVHAESSPELTVEDAPSPSPAKRKADGGHASLPLPSSKRTKGNNGKSTTDDEDQCGDDFLSEERQRFTKLWRSNVMLQKLLYSLASDEYDHLPVQEQESVNKLLSSNKTWVETNSSVMAMEVNLPMLRQSVVDAVRAIELTQYASFKKASDRERLVDKNGHDDDNGHSDESDHDDDSENEHNAESDDDGKGYGPGDEWESYRPGDEWESYRPGDEYEDEEDSDQDEEDGGYTSPVASFYDEDQ